MDRLTNPIMSVNWMHIVMANCYSSIKRLRAGCMSRANTGLSRNDKQPGEDGIRGPSLSALPHLGKLCHPFLLNYLKDAVSHS